MKHGVSRDLGFPARRRPRRWGGRGIAAVDFTGGTSPPEFSRPGPWNALPVQMQVEGWTAPPHLHLFPEGWTPRSFPLSAPTLTGGSGHWDFPWMEPVS